MDDNAGVTLATPLHGVISVLDRLRARQVRAGELAATTPSPGCELQPRFETWRIVRWDDETAFALPPVSVTTPVCDRDPIAAQRTERNRRVRT